jgi:chromosome segregation ATPase
LRLFINPALLVGGLPRRSKMILFIILGAVVLLTFAVLGVLFFMLNKEGQKRENEKVVPITDLEQLKKELSSKLFEQDDIKITEEAPEIVAEFTPKVSLPTQETQVFAGDEAYKKRARALEDELQSISKKADGQSDEARQLIESLTEENESLKRQQANLEEARQQLIELQKEASGLKVENASLQTQLESTSAKVLFLEEQMAAVKIQMGEEISRAHATVSAMKQEKEESLSAPKPEPDLALRQELETLRSEQDQLKQKYEELEKEHQQLQYELIKAKAQSSGLERVSFNYKNQLEDFFKKINAVQVTNDQLSQVKNRLEGMVQEVKLQNEELLKKDQLAQFELEKNRSRLVNLEREYEDFKARSQQQNQQ